jgi:TetR/AcrR family transcriptional regulator, transcriptional repressor for nem operon
MRRSQSDTAETRRRIVEAAARLFRGRGIDAVSVADIMGELGLTVGGFYRHFVSKEALVAEAIEAASLESIARQEGLDSEALLDAYLSQAHRAHADRGCPVAALCSEVGHAPRSTKKAFTAALERLLKTVDSHTGGSGKSKREQVLRQAAELVGALVLARASSDDDLAAELLAAVRHARAPASAPPAPRRRG